LELAVAQSVVNHARARCECVPLRLGAAIAGIVACASVCTVTAAERHTFAVKDSIAITRLVDPDASLVAFVPPKFKLSPDGTKLIVVTRHGDLARGVNDYSLILFDVNEVLAFVNSKRSQSLPRQDVLFTMSSFTGTAWYQPAIDQITWLPDSQTIALIARNGEPGGHACLYDLSTRKLTELTDSRSDVASFEISRDRGTIIYTAYVSPYIPHIADMITREFRP
jgi:hypothetical protein